MILTGLAVGAVLGIVMQRGRFCVTGMLRDIFLQKTWRTTVALFIVISVHAVGIAALTSFGIITPKESAFAPIAVIVGGFVFGLGIILAGGCASGTWFRSAEGLIGSWFALVFYALSAAAMNTGALTWLNDGLAGYETSLTTLPASFGVSAWFFAIPLAIGTALAARFYLSTEKPPAKLNVPFWKRPLHLYTAGALVGLIGVIAWPLSAAAGRNSGLGITTPSANIANFITTGDVERVDWGVMLVLGLFIGAFAAAKATGEFRLRVPDATTATRAVVGGCMMGVGAALAGGCTVGNGMVQTALFSYQGWIALLFIALGVGAGAKIWLKPARESAEDEVLPVAAPAPAPAFQVATGAVALKTAPRVKKARPIAEGRYALDQMGAVCPFPLIETKDVINTLESGEELVIDFDCTQGTETIPQWAANNGHDVTDFHATGDASWQITIRKG